MSVLLSFASIERLEVQVTIREYRVLLLSVLCEAYRRYSFEEGASF